MGENQKVFAVVFEAHMVDPNLHVWNNVFDRTKSLPEGLDLLERSTVWKIINFKLLYSLIREVSKVTAYNFN